jgi:uncharacterized membrane protein
MLYFVLKFIHIIGACVLLGTGAGIAFFMLAAHRTGKASTIAPIARIVVLADFIFTATAVIVQPLSGVALAWSVGYALTEGWIVISILLYILTGIFWLPVVLMQIEMRDLAVAAAQSSERLPRRYHDLFRRWFIFGFPAFAAVLAIVWLMITRPVW